jgi:hypothetical protein
MKSQMDVWSPSLVPAFLQPFVLAIMYIKALVLPDDAGDEWSSDISVK